METQVTFAIISRDGDILYRTADGKEYVVKYEDICQRKLEMVKVAQLTDLPIKDVCQIFGFKSKQTYYHAKGVLEEIGSVGLFPRKTGPKRNYVMSEELVTRAIELRFRTNWNMYAIGEKLREEGFPVRDRMVGEIFEKYRITVKKTPKKRLDGDAVNSSLRRK
jgi:transposase